MLVVTLDAIGIRTCLSRFSVPGMFEPLECVGIIYEIDHCTAFGPCSARGITPSSLLVHNVVVCRHNVVVCGLLQSVYSCQMKSILGCMGSPFMDMGES